MGDFGLFLLGSGLLVVLIWILLKMNESTGVLKDIERFIRTDRI